MSAMPTPTQAIFEPSDSSTLLWLEPVPVDALLANMPSQ